MHVLLFARGASQSSVEFEARVEMPAALQQVELETPVETVLPPGEIGGQQGLTLLRFELRALVGCLVAGGVGWGWVLFSETLRFFSFQVPEAPFSADSLCPELNEAPAVSKAEFIPIQVSVYTHNGEPPALACSNALLEKTPDPEKVEAAFVRRPRVLVSVFAR